MRLDRRIAWCSDGRLATINDEQREESLTESVPCTLMPSGDVSVQAPFDVRGSRRLNRLA